MCVSYCVRQNWLFWNHEPCSPIFCPVVSEQHGSCQTCHHRAGDNCGLTHAPLPDNGGCCHWNVSPVEVPVPVSPALVAPLAGFFDTVGNILAQVPHQVVETGWVFSETYIDTLEALGIGYQVSHEGLRVNPEQLILTIDEPVTAILDRLDAPYSIEPDTGLVMIEPKQLQLPLCFGQGTAE